MDTNEPRWHPVAIKAAPKLGSIYWCKFHDSDHVHLPEMWKERPVVIATHRDLRIKGSCFVAPLSTDSQERNKWAMPVPDYIVNKIDNRPSWILCNNLTTVSTSRLRQVDGSVLMLSKVDVATMLEIIREWLPKPIK